MKYWLGWGPGSLPIHHRPLPLGTFTPGPPPAGIFIRRTNFSPTRNPPRARGPLVRKTKRQGSSTGAANKQASSPTPLPPPRTRNFCAIAHEHDGVDGPAQCGDDARRRPPLLAGARAFTRTHNRARRADVYRRPRTIGNARTRSRSRRGCGNARPILSPAGTPLTIR